MKHGISTHIRTNAVGYVALFFALGGGTAMALDGSNTVFSDDIVAGAVRSSDIGTGQVRGGDIGANAVRTGRILNGEVRDRDIASDAVRGTHIVDGEVRGADVADDGLTGADIDESSLGPVPSADNVLSASVASGGALTGGIGAQGASKSTAGNYDVDFNRPIVGSCAATVTLADSLSGEATVFVPSEIFDASVINVHTATSSGAPSDRAFDVTVVC